MKLVIEFVLAYLLLLLILTVPLETATFIPVVKTELKDYSTQLTPILPRFKPKSGKSHLKVMVIDSGISYNNFLYGKVDFANQKEEDYDVSLNGHGTHVTGIVIYGDMIEEQNRKNPICDQIEIISCNIYKPWHFQINEKISGLPLEEMIIEGNKLITKMEGEVRTKTTKCVRDAIRLKVDVINYSSEGDASDFDEYHAWQDFSKSGGVSIVAAGNKHSNLMLRPRFPSSFGVRGSLPIESIPNFYSVVSVDRLGRRLPTSNFYPDAVKELGDNVHSTIPGSNSFLGSMTGTSQAAPMFLHKALKQYCRENKLNFRKNDYVSRLLSK